MIFLTRPPKLLSPATHQTDKMKKKKTNKKPPKTTCIFTRTSNLHALIFAILKHTSVGTFYLILVVSIFAKKFTDNSREQKKIIERKHVHRCECAQYTYQEATQCTHGGATEKEKTNTMPDKREHDSKSIARARKTRVRGLPH